MIIPIKIKELIVLILYHSRPLLLQQLGAATTFCVFLPLTVRAICYLSI